MQGIISYNGYDIIVENIDNNDVYYYSKDNKTFVGSKMSLSDFIYKIENVYFKKTNFEKIKEEMKNILLLIWVARIVLVAISVQKKFVAKMQLKDGWMSD